MRRLPFILLFLTAVVLGIATFIEDSRGTEFIHSAVYGAAWFKVLWAIVAVTAIHWMWRAKLYRRVAVFMLHVSLLLILLGGLVTALTHKGGMLHLRQGRTESQYLADNHRLADLPFVIHLDTFYIQYYPGTETAQDYVSRVSIGSLGLSPEPPLMHEGGKRTDWEERLISMNRILRQDGYRLYQSSYDPDGHGSWLKVTYDPYGTAIAYAGFLLFGLSGIGVLLGRRSSFHQLLREFRTTGIQAPILLVLLLFQAQPALAERAGAESETIPSVSRAAADSMARRLVVWNGRVCPFNTLATDFVTKIYGKRRCKGYTPEQVVASWLRYPDIWNCAPLIKVKDAELRRRLGMHTSHCSYIALFDANGNYRLQPLWETLADKHGKLAKAIQQVDEKAALITMLQKGTLIQEVAASGEGDAVETADVASAMLSDMRIRAELLYNRVPFVSILFMANLTLGLLCFLLILSPRTRRVLDSFWLRVPLMLSLFTLLVAYVLRWYVSGRVPLSNGFETMMFAVLMMQTTALVLCRRQPMVIPFGYLLSGFLLLVAHLGVMNPQITNLMPVLQSPWLSSHVSIIMVAYTLLGFTFFSSLTGLFMPRSSLTTLSRLLLYPAVFFLFVGIFLGAIWANVSWGTYWSWDPKEVWALITVIVYAIPLHRESLAWVRNDRLFNIYLVFAFFTVLMTYFGVNFLLGGMHSYAN